VPGVDPESVRVRCYSPALPEAVLGTDRWKRPTNTGEEIIKDIIEIRRAYLEQRPINFGDALVTDLAGEDYTGKDIALPDTIILDGMTEMPQIIVDWILGVNKKIEASDFTGESGATNKYILWQKRATTVRDLLHMIIPLPANVILIGWEIAEVVNDRPTGKIVPDIGGKLDNLLPGKVDAALRCYARYDGSSPRYMVQCAPDGVREWVGVRGIYGGAREVDVTLAPGKALPWERVFGPESGSSRRA
jgi:hypothetical protein